jgi:hypothetical protein
MESSGTFKGKTINRSGYKFESQYRVMRDKMIASIYEEVVKTKKLGDAIVIQIK